MGKKKTTQKPGRPRKFVLTKTQLEEMDTMAFNQCKHRTIAEALGVGRENLVNNYLPRLHKKAAEGRVKLRETQRGLSKKFPAMAIFLGKNELEQTDKQEVTGKDGSPIKIQIVDFAKIPDDTE